MTVQTINTARLFCQRQIFTMSMIDIDESKITLCNYDKRIFKQILFLLGFKLKFIAAAENRSIKIYQLTEKI